MTQTATPVAPAQNKENGVAKVELTHSERFAIALEKEFASNAGEIQLTSFQRRLCQNYFIKIDMVLADTEMRRLKKFEKYRDAVPVIWNNVNMKQLAIDVISFSGVGLDPTQPNHLNPIPYKNNGTGKYDITFIPGYKGIEIKATKYGLNVPDDVIVELVCKNDVFKVFKKDLNNKVEGYHFEITESFDRGDVVGGFYYHVFEKTPEKNKLRVFTLKDILKRKPVYASAEFWGGEKDKWVDGKKAEKEEVEGWAEEMYYKTIYRAGYSAITIDSEKIDENYMAVIQRENDARDMKVLNEISNNANRNEIGFEDEPPIQDAEFESTADENGEVVPENKVIENNIPETEPAPF